MQRNIFDKIACNILLNKAIWGAAMADHEEMMSVKPDDWTAMCDAMRAVAVQEINKLRDACRDTGHVPDLTILAAAHRVADHALPWL